MNKEEKKKRFPADAEFKEKTISKNLFLTDKNIDGKLYAYFQSISVAHQIEIRTDEDLKKINYNNLYETRVIKKDIPPVTNIIKQLGIKSRTTYYKRFKYLIEKGYIVEYDDYYLLDNKEEYYLLIPLSTLIHITAGLSSNAIKAYIFLGTAWNWKNGKHSTYSFTLKELAEHIGIELNNHSERYEELNGILIILQALGLIDYEDYYEKRDGYVIPRKRLTKVEQYIDSSKEKLLPPNTLKQLEELPFNF